MTLAHAWRWLWLLTAAGLLSQATIHLVRPATTYKLLSIGAGEVTVGLVTGFYALMPLVFALYVGARAQKVLDLGRLLAVGCLMTALGAGVIASVNVAVGIATGSALLGLGQLVFMLAGQAAVARFTEARHMDLAFGWFTVGLSGGQLLGPLLGGALLGGMREGGPGALGVINGALWTGAILSLASIAFVLFTGGAFRGGAPAPYGKSDLKGVGAQPSARLNAESLWELMRIPRMKSHMVASIAMISILDILSAFMPLLGENAGVSPLWVGILLALRAAASIASRSLLTVFRKRWSRDALVLAALWVSGLALTVMPLLLSHIWAATACLIVAGFFLGLGQPLTMSLVAQSVHHDWRSYALAVRLMGNRLGQVIVPIAAGALAVPLGPAGPIWMGCGLLVASGMEKGARYFRK